MVNALEALSTERCGVASIWRNTALRGASVTPQSTFRLVSLVAIVGSTERGRQRVPCIRQPSHHHQLGVAS
jgi:hypothetical protein